MKFGLVALSSLIILVSSNTKDLIGYANQKTRQEMTQKINTNVQSKLSGTFGNDKEKEKENQGTSYATVSAQGTGSGDQKYTEINAIPFTTVAKPSAAKTVFPIIQNTPVNTNVQNVSTDKGSSIITVSPVTTVVKPAFVQTSPAPVLSSLQSVRVAT